MRIQQIYPVVVTIFRELLCPEAADAEVVEGDTRTVSWQECDRELRGPLPARYRPVGGRVSPTTISGL